MAITNVTVGTGTGGVGTATVSTTVSYEAARGTTAIHQLVQEVNANSPLGHTIVTLTVGDNTLAIGTKAAGVIIQPDPAQAATVLTLKGNAADVGVVLGYKAPIKLPFANPPPASIILNVTVQMSSVEVMFY